MVKTHDWEIALMPWVTAYIAAGREANRTLVVVPVEGFGGWTVHPHAQPDDPPGAVAD
jgi:hypothetical protein